jgi:hypothetical protein
MARTPKLQSHLILAEKVSRWAKEYGATDDPYIKAITDGLVSRKRWPMFATLDPFILLPHPNSSPSSLLKRLSFALTLVRNILVFVPVALTWSAVSHATSAFAIYVSRNTGSVANFLEFWQNGFHILGREWVIGYIAFLDFLLITIVIALTVAVSFTDRRISMIEEAQIEMADTARIEIGLAIVDFFFDKRTLTPLVMNQSMAQGVNRLTSSTESLARSTKILQDISKDALKSIRKIQ